jgi:hypothetical protein
MVKMDASLHREFSYSPLPRGSIRLLEITTECGRLPNSLNQHGLFDTQDVLVLQIHVADLKEPPHYDALSYTWGNPLSTFETEGDWQQTEQRYSSKVPILCDGKLLHIGVSLYETLVALRRTLREHDDLGVTSEDLSSPRLGAMPFVRDRIWIDAICINQSNHEERNMQVKMMDLIYKKADAVLIWLGPQDTVAKQAARAMVNLSMSPQLVAQTLDLSDHHRSVIFKQASSLPILDFGWHCIVSLLHRQWFRRCWIIQEVAWARIPLIMCDYRLWIDWNLLLATSDWMVDNEKHRDIWLKPWLERSATYFEPPGYSGLNSIDLVTRTIQSMGRVRHEVETDNPSLTMTVKEGINKSNLFELLVRFWDSECSVHHDKVYALFSLCQDQALLDSIPVDYSISVAELYIEVTRGMLMRESRLDLLAFCPAGILSERLSLPSWVPDWSRKPDPMPIGYEEWQDGTGSDYGKVRLPFCADGITENWSPPIWAGNSLNLASRRHLNIQGKRVASIRSIAPLKLDELDSIAHMLHEMPSKYSYFKSVTATPGKGFPNTPGLPNEEEIKSGHQAWAESNETRSEALWRTVLADIWNSCHPAPDEAGLAFMRFLASELGKATDKLGSRGLSETTLLPGDSNSPLERRRDNLEALLRFLSEDEQACLDEYYGRSKKETQQDEPPPDWLATPPRQYLPCIEPDTDISDIVASLHVRDDKDLLHYHKYFTGSRLLFSTENGKLGLGPVSMRCGDAVWIINGSNYPILLRQCSESIMEVVGPAYVHGIMHGQEVGCIGGMALPFSGEKDTVHDIVLE